MTDNADSLVNAVSPDLTFPEEDAGVSADQVIAESARTLGDEILRTPQQDFHRKLESHEAGAMGRYDDPRHAPSSYQGDIWTDVCPSDTEPGRLHRDADPYQNLIAGERHGAS